MVLPTANEKMKTSRDKLFENSSKRRSSNGGEPSNILKEIQTDSGSFNREKNLSGDDNYGSPLTNEKLTKCLGFGELDEKSLSNMADDGISRVEEEARIITRKSNDFEAWRLENYFNRFEYPDENYSFKIYPRIEFTGTRQSMSDTRKDSAKKMLNIRNGPSEENSRNLKIPTPQTENVSKEELKEERNIMKDSTGIFKRNSTFENIEKQVEASQPKRKNDSQEDPSYVASGNLQDIQKLTKPKNETISIDHVDYSFIRDAVAREFHVSEVIEGRKAPKERGGFVDSFGKIDNLEEEECGSGGDESLSIFSHSQGSKQGNGIISENKLITGIERNEIVDEPLRIDHVLPKSDEKEIRKMTSQKRSKKSERQEEDGKKVKAPLYQTLGESLPQETLLTVKPAEKKTFIDKATQTLECLCKCLENKEVRINAVQRIFVDKATQTLDLPCKCSQNQTMSRKKRKRNEEEPSQFLDSEREQVQSSEQSRKKDSIAAENNDELSIPKKKKKKTSSKPKKVIEDHVMVFENLAVKMIHKALPQHQVEKTAGSRPPSKKESIKFETFRKMRLKSFKSREDDLIVRNWHNFCLLHDWDESLCKPFLKWLQENHSSISSMEQRKKFVQFIAKDLDNRSLFSVMNRFEELFSSAKNSD